MRLIDADALLRRVERWRDRIVDTYGKNDEYANCLAEVVMKIEDAPTADVVERKVGEWIDDCSCSVCNWINENDNGFALITNFRFCPNCGAVMFDKDTDVRSKGGDDGV